MSATNLDLPVLIPGEQIRRREFVTIRRGYDPAQVRAYMDQLADQVELMQSLIREARAEAEAAIRAMVKPHADPYEELAKRVSGVIREADAASEKILGSAREDAERMTLEARTDADRIRTDAQARAEETRAAAEAAFNEARAEADRTIAGLADRRDALVERLASMQEHLLEVARDLERTIDADGERGHVAEASIQEPPAPERPTERARAAWAAGPAQMPPAPATATPEQADPRHMDESHASGAELPADEMGVLFAEVDSGDEDPWEGVQAMRLEVPEIPPLDLDWGPPGEDLDPLEG